MKKASLILILLTFCFSTISIAQSDILEVIRSSKEHTTLASMVKAADLANTLKGEGPFTIFAPTNTAFDTLPAEKLENLLKPETKAS